MSHAVVSSRNGQRLRVPPTFNSLFDEFFAQAARAVQPAAGFLPTADVIETAEGYELHLAVPGFRKEDLQLNVEEGRLTVSGERRFTPDENRTYRFAESRFGAFERTFHLPDTVDHSHITAALDLGILTVRLPKDAQKTAKHRIEIQ